MLRRTRLQGNVQRTALASAMKALALAIVLGVVQSAHPIAADEPGNPLIVYSGGRDVHQEKFRGTDQLTYRLTAKYPASVVIDRISQKLRREGWEPLKNDFLNPQLPSHEWNYFLKGTKQPEICVHQWLGDWRSSSGDIVRYVLRYEKIACETSDLNDLQVIAIRIPSAEVRRGLQALEEWKKRHPPTSSHAP